jgi:protein-disulfide isomerase
MGPGGERAAGAGVAALTVRWLLGWLLLAAPAFAQTSAPAYVQMGAGGFTPAQRAEIVAIVRDALKTDPSILRDAVTALQQDQQTKSSQASTQAILANKEVIFANPGDPVAGNPAARVTLVEFFDVRCPYCRKMRPDVEALLRQDTDVRVIMKDLPVLGPASVLGAKALLAAQAQGGYLKMQDALMREGVTVDEAAVQRAAQAAGLDWPKLKQAMDAPGIQMRIGANTALALKLGIEGTPAFVVGDQLVAGVMSLDELKAAVAALRSG